MYGTDFWISSRGQLRNRTKLKIIGFSKTARWISMKIKLRGHFSILSWEYQKHENQNLKKIDFLKILLICTYKVEKIGKFSSPILKFFYNWRWKYIKNWLLPFIFSEFHRAVYEKPIIFNFVRFLSWRREEIKKSVPYIFFSVPFSVGWKKTAWRYLKWLLRNACRKFGSSWKKST